MEAEMSDDIRLSDSNLPDFRADASRGELALRQTVRRSGGSRRIDIGEPDTFEPIIQSAVAIVRESAGLLCHIAGFGIALVWDPNSQPKCGTGRTRPVAPEGANVIAFPSSKCRATAAAPAAPDFT
jgi:hypothetical protein